MHVRVPRFRPSTWLDGAIGALGVTACVTTFALAPSLDMAGLEANAATLTYPVADVLLLALVAAVIAVRGLHHDRTMLLVSLAFVFKLIGDLLLTRAQAQGGYVVGGPTDLTGWPRPCSPASPPCWPAPGGTTTTRPAIRAPAPAGGPWLCP